MSLILLLILCHPYQLQADNSLYGLTVGPQIWAHFSTLRSFFALYFFSIFLCGFLFYPEISCVPENCSFCCFMALVTYKGNLVVFSRVLPRASFHSVMCMGIQTHGPAHINTPVVYNDRCLDPPFLERILWLHIQLPIGHSYPWKSHTSVGKKQKEKKKKNCSWQ